MIQNKEVTFVTKVVTDNSDKPWEHNTTETSEKKETFSVNVTSLDNERMIRDYGVSDAVMYVIRSFTPLSTFDYVLIDDVKFVNAGSQAIEGKRSIIVKEESL